MAAVPTVGLCHNRGALSLGNSSPVRGLLANCLIFALGRGDSKQTYPLPYREKIFIFQGQFTMQNPQNHSSEQKL